MLCKRILILQQTNGRFAEFGKELCGMVKVVNSQNNTTVTVFVTNADVKTQGEWWVLLSLSGKVFAQKLSTLNNYVFNLPLQQLDNVGCLLVKREDALFEVARASLGNADLCNSLYTNMSKLISNDLSQYEQFVASTSNFYPDQVAVDVGKLRQKADDRYQSVSEYSDAFERFYASGNRDNYYQTVSQEITKLFVQFPPYYPLINKYKGSFFVRIDFPSSEKYFVLGVLQQQGYVKYICYGLPATSKEFSDKDFIFVENQPTSFWMLFQDAKTGQITSLPSPV